jgi:hypothetical protein
MQMHIYLFFVDIQRVRGHLLVFKPSETLFWYLKCLHFYLKRASGTSFMIFIIMSIKKAKCYYWIEKEKCSPSESPVAPCPSPTIHSVVFVGVLPVLFVRLYDFPFPCLSYSLYSMLFVLIKYDYTANLSPACFPSHSIHHVIFLKRCLISLLTH